MGQSTDGILFYGIHADEGEWDEQLGDEWEEEYASKKGVPAPTVEYDTAAHKALHQAFWDKKHDLTKAEPCAVDTHCSGECPMPYAFVKASKTRASRGYPQQITSLAVQPEWDAQLRAFCETMGIPWQQPKWWLVSDWN